MTYRTAAVLLWIPLIAGCDLAAFVAGAIDDAIEDDHRFVWLEKLGDGTGEYQAAEPIALHADGTSAAVIRVRDRLSRYTPEDQPHVSRVIKLSATGGELWHADFHREGGVPQPIDVSIDAAGNVIVLGINPPWIGRVDARGRHSTRVNTTVPELGRPHRLVAVEDGNIVIAGNPDLFDLDIRVVKLDANDELVWSRKLGDGVGSGNFGIRVALAPDNQVVVAAEVGTKNYDVLIQKYDTDGTELWDAPVKYATDASDELGDVAVLPDGRVLAAGSTCDDDRKCSAWADLYDSSGAALWPRPFRLDATPFEASSFDEDAVELEEQIHNFVRADAVAVSPSGAAVIIGRRGRASWLQQLDRDGRTVPACNETGCTSPLVYSARALLRQVKIDHTGHLLLAWPSGITDGEVQSPNGNMWVGKLAAPLVP
jgi:hypothetical protein